MAYSAFDRSVGSIDRAASLDENEKISKYCSVRLSGSTWGERGSDLLVLGSGDVVELKDEEEELLEVEGKREELEDEEEELCDEVFMIEPAILSAIIASHK